jgi:peptidylprolyl isomerase
MRPPGAEPTTPSAATATGTAPDATAILEALHPDRAEPPTELLVVDLVEGDGRPSCGGGRRRAVLGVRWSDGGTFDASWTAVSRSRSRSVPGRSSRDGTSGSTGMRIGGRRVLTIPPALAYGDRGAGNVIGPGETLVFIVDLIDAVAP